MAGREGQRSATFLLTTAEGVKWIVGQALEDAVAARTAQSSFHRKPIAPGQPEVRHLGDAGPVSLQTSHHLESTVDFASIRDPWIGGLAAHRANPRLRTPERAELVPTFALVIQLNVGKGPFRTEYGLFRMPDAPDNEQQKRGAGRQNQTGSNSRYLMGGGSCPRYLRTARQPRRLCRRQGVHPPRYGPLMGRVLGSGDPMLSA